MRGHINKGDQHPREIAEFAYTDEFLSRLGHKFDFDALNPEIMGELREIASDYIYWRRLQASMGISPKVKQRRYRQFQKSAERLMRQLKYYDNREIDSLIRFGANRLRAPTPPSHLVDFTKHKKLKGLPFYREFVRFLEFIGIGTNEMIEDLKLPGGRRQNFGLENLTIKAAEFWESRLGRKFTVDYHEGKGLTKAFDFVRDLVTPLDEVPDKKIVTAMRSEITERRKNRVR